MEPTERQIETVARLIMADDKQFKLGAYQGDFDALKLDQQLRYIVRAKRFFRVLEAYGAWGKP